ncbi:MAG: hypothetical protein ACHQ2E_03175, partial [Gemmatimonadales bacterium]
RACLAAVVGLDACGAPPRTPPSPQPAPVDSGDRLALADAAGDVITAALDADARLETADSLYSPAAQSIADGHYRTSPPRFAGLEAGGSLAVGSMQVVVRDSLVWAIVEYRWFSPLRTMSPGRPWPPFSSRPRMAARGGRSCTHTVRRRDST